MKLCMVACSPLLLLHRSLEHTAEALEKNIIFSLQPTNFHVALSDINIEYQRDLNRVFDFGSLRLRLRFLVVIFFHFHSLTLTSC